MKLYRVGFALVALATLVGIAYVGQAVESSGARMTSTAQRLVDSLNDEQRAKAVFSFDDKERTNWHFVPYQTPDKKPMRKGLRLEDMTEAQRDMARDLLKVGTSPEGYTKANTIMGLEAILRELEMGKGAVRDPQWYFFAFFGAPSKTGRWGWRVEGHHLSLNFVVDGGQLVSATPFFLGANPAVIPDGPRKGERPLPETEDLVKDLVKSLDESQRKVALQEKQFGEIEEGKPAAGVGEPKGLPAAKMTEGQKASLLKLLEAYANRMPAEVAETELRQMKEAGLDKVHFAYAGSLEPGKEHSYRVQGPTFVIQFLNVQADSARNPANHIHSAWRSLKGDFGLVGK
jgi:hypothetical protein